MREITSVEGNNHDKGGTGDLFVENREKDERNSLNMPGERERENKKGKERERNPTGGGGGVRRTSVGGRELLWKKE